MKPSDEAMRIWGEAIDASNPRIGKGRWLNFDSQAAALVIDRALSPVVDGVPVIDLDKEFFRQMCDAAGQSNWIPPEYMVNDWVADCCDFLRNGRKVTQPTADAATVERVAKAICRVNTEQRCRVAKDIRQAEIAEAVECQVANGWDLWEQEAKAAIAAINDEPATIIAPPHCPRCGCDTDSDVHRMGC